MRTTMLLICLGFSACAGTNSRPLTQNDGLRVADAALAGGAPRMALDVARHMLAKSPKDAPALVREGDAFFAMGRLPEAAAAYKRALQLDPTNIQAKLGLGRTRVRVDPREAEALFLQILAVDPANAAALNDLGIARDLQGRHRAAQEAYTKAAGLDPEMTAAQVNLGLSLALSGDGSHALEILRPLGASPIATARVREDLAVALVAAGDETGARRVLGADMTEAEATDIVSGLDRLRAHERDRVN